MISGFENKDYRNGFDDGYEKGRADGIKDCADDAIDVTLRQGKKMGWKGFGKKFIEKAEQEKDEIYNWDSDEYENGMKAGYQYCIEIAEELLKEKPKNGNK